jgi:hypothetical protein
MSLDPKQIARDWNREIEAEIRRLAKGRDDGRWKIVVWVLLWVLWCALLFGMFAWLKALQW